MPEHGFPKSLNSKAMSYFKGDRKYFHDLNKGSLHELRVQLVSEKTSHKNCALKRIIAGMTIGKDVSSLFPEVVNCMQTDNIELKKLVYLYLMNYARSRPDLAILAVNTFIKDSEDANPLIRALAIRTMGCIDVDEITEYLAEPLRRCLQDEDPYVRKTSAICVAKLYELRPEQVIDLGFVELLLGLLSDANSMVVANAVAALSEINEKQPLTTQLVNNLLTALSDCPEWGKVFILEAVATFKTTDDYVAQNICERIASELSSTNAAIVFPTLRILLNHMHLLRTKCEFTEQLPRKFTAPLVTLLAAEPEIQFVALRIIQLFARKSPELLRRDLKVTKKLDVLVRLVDQTNIAMVLSELKEYATEVDVDFVTKSVRAIGRCAIKVEESSGNCVSTLLDLIKTKVNYIVQEAILVVKDIFRKYPGRYESIIGILCENLESLDKPSAKASMIWIIGEYAERIDNADELLNGFLEAFNDEAPSVQLQLLTAVVKLFLKCPSDTQHLVQKVLALSTETSYNPDLRDRAYIYWRLLSSDPEIARQVVLAERPLISEPSDLLEPSLLDELLQQIGSLASVYHKPAHSFVDTTRRPREATVDLSLEEINADEIPNDCPLFTL
ncbi:unnamed protein product, partial [Mesorhabditis spiculigera]